MYNDQLIKGFLKKIIPFVVFGIVFLFTYKPISSYLVKERQAVKEKSKKVTLSYFVPSFDAIIDSIQNDGQFDKEYVGPYIRYYNKLLEFYPHRVNAHSILGFGYFHQGKLEKALSFYQEAALLNPHFFWNHYNLAVLYYRDGRFEKSIESIAKTISLKPEMTLVIINKAPVYKQIWRNISQTDVLEEKLISNIKSGFSDAHILLILNQYALENYSEVLKATKHGIQSGFDNLDFYYYYSGLALFQMKNFEGAGYFFQKCIKNNSEHTDALRYLGLTLKELGNEKAASDIMQMAIVLERDNGSRTQQSEKIVPRIF